MPRIPTREGEITRYGLEIAYEIDVGLPGRYGSGIDLHDSYPDDEPEVTVKSATVVNREEWEGWLAEFCREPDYDPKDFCTDDMAEDCETAILEEEQLR